MRVVSPRHDPEASGLLTTSQVALRKQLPLTMQEYSGGTDEKMSAPRNFTVLAST